MGDKGEIVYSPVEPFSGARTPDDSLRGALGASNGAVTGSMSIPACRVAWHSDVRDAYEQVEQLAGRLEGWG